MFVTSFFFKDFAKTAKHQVHQHKTLAQATLALSKQANISLQVGLSFSLPCSVHQLLLQSLPLCQNLCGGRSAWF